MRTSHKAKDAAAEKQSYACDTFTGHGKAHQPPPPGSPVRVFPVMLLGKADEGAAIDLVRGRGDDASGPAAGSSVNRGPSGAGLRSGLDFGESGGLQRHLRQAVGRIRGQVMYPRPVHGAASYVAQAWRDPYTSARGC